MSIRWFGIDDLRRHLRDSERQVLAAVAGALYEEASETMTESKRLVPVDLGVLRGSGTVFAPEVDGGRVSVTIGYGGAASDYAVVQHERVDFHHTVGQAKYLEQPVRERSSGFAVRVAAGVRKRLP